MRQFWAPILSGAPWYKFRLADGLQESRCFGCGEAWPSLHGAHILARMAGGSDDVSNLHLLCPMCHRASEGLYGLAYWRWLLRQNEVAAILLGAGLRIYAACGRLPDRYGPIDVDQIKVLAAEFARGTVRPFKSTYFLDS